MVQILATIHSTGSKYLMWILLECVHVHIRTNKHSNITRIYERLVKRKKGSSIAAVAAAAKLLKVAFWIMEEKREYQNHG